MYFSCSSCLVPKTSQAIMTVDFLQSSSTCKFMAAQKIGLNRLTAGGPSRCSAARKFIQFLSGPPQKLGHEGVVSGHNMLIQDSLENCLMALAATMTLVSICPIEHA